MGVFGGRFALETTRTAPFHTHHTLPHVSRALDDDWEEQVEGEVDAATAGEGGLCAVDQKLQEAMGEGLKPVPQLVGGCVVAGARGQAGWRVQAATAEHADHMHGHATAHTPHLVSCFAQLPTIPLPFC